MVVSFCWKQAHASELALMDVKSTWYISGNNLAARLPVVATWDMSACIAGHMPIIIIVAIILGICPCRMVWDLDIYLIYVMRAEKERERGMKRGYHLTSMQVVWIGLNLPNNPNWVCTCRMLNIWSNIDMVFPAKIRIWRSTLINLAGLKSVRVKYSIVGWISAKVWCYTYMQGVEILIVS